MAGEAHAGEARTDVAPGAIAQTGQGQPCQDELQPCLAERQQSLAERPPSFAERGPPQLAWAIAASVSLTPLAGCGGEGGGLQPLPGDTSGLHRAPATTTATDPAPLPPIFADRRLGLERFARRRMISARQGSAPAVRVELPEAADRPFLLSDARAVLGIAVHLVDAQPAARRSFDGLSVYADAAGAGSTLVLRTSDVGVEDFVTFATPPAAAEVDYRVELDAAVAGLRLVERTLEFLDATGTPRLRVAPPELRGADGAVVNAELAVLDCAVDESPAPPWGRPPVAPGASSCTLRISWHRDTVRYPALLDPAWLDAAGMSVPRARFSSHLIDQGRVLAAGGISGSAEAPTASSELYDPATDTWATTGSLNSARSMFTLNALPMSDGTTRALAVGGRALDGSLASSESYDPTTGTWSFGPQLSAARAGHAAVTLDDGALLVAGGTARTAELLESGAANWRSAGELLAEEPGSTLSALNGGGALLVGPNAPIAQRYDAAERAWRVAGEARAPALPRSGHSATQLLDGRVLLVGGHVSQLVELYDPASDGFSWTGAAYSPHVEHTATRLGDGRVAIVGGLASGAAGGIEIYDPTWGTWVPGPGTPTTRFAHRAELLASGQLLSFGGFEASPPEAGDDAPPLEDEGPLTSADRLDPARPTVEIGEYRLPAGIDPDITSSTATELWASVTRPASLADGERHPLLVFLHGNHATCGTGENPRRDSDCSYTLSGVCPADYTVVPSHRGYDYAATELAARGFIVVSVNANRGINCGAGEDGDFGFNLARGRLLLAHLRQLSEWDRGLSPTPESVGVSLVGKLDFSEVGMMGHSRGGEGIRAAYQQYRDLDSPWPARIGPVDFRALFEIGPVDGQTSRVLDADGVAWAVLLPMCDGDVSNLEGVKPFDRMLGRFGEVRESPKSTFVAWGANHNYFNTEWQESDSFGCENHRPLFGGDTTVTGSAEQRQVALRGLLAFFLANVGHAHNPALNELFDPSSPLESGSRIDRGHTPSLRPSRAISLEDFSGRTGLSARGLPITVHGVQLAHEAVPEHDPSLRSARVEWFAMSAGEPPEPTVSRFLELPMSARSEGIDLSGYTHLEFRAGRARGGDLFVPSRLSVQLVNADGSLSEPVDAGDFGLRLDGPVGGPFNTHVVLQTARIPLGAFVGGTRAALRGVRFGFPDVNAAELYLASVRASLGSASLSPREHGRGSVGPRLAASSASVPGSAAGANDSGIILGTKAPVVHARSAAGNRIIGLRALDAGSIELELASARPFQARGDRLVLVLGGLESARSHHPNGDLSRVIFRLDAVEFASVADGERVLVRYGANDALEWDFGALDKDAPPNGSGP